jgi:hypothetical protein
MVDATTIAHGQAPQGAQNRSGVPQNSNLVGLRGRLPSAIARRYHMPGGMNGSER